MPLYRFHWDCGRQGCLDGVFEATPEDVASAMGTNVYFGEVLGKFSEINGEIEEGDIELLTDDQEFIDRAKKYGVIPQGFNPFDYIDEGETT